MKKTMKKMMSLWMVAMVLMTSACSSSDSKEPSPVVSDSMKVEVTTAPVGLHPLKTNDSPSSYVSSQIFETLYLRSVDGTTYEPLLAKELPEFSEDGMTATIHLREGVQFHDGTPFTAEAVAYMIDSLKNPDYGSMRPSVVESIESYEIIDDLTIQLNLAYEDGVLVAKLAHTNSCIVNPALDQSQDLMINPTGAGTGAYEFVSAETGSSYVLKANENYWKGSPEVKEIRFDVISDEATAVARLQTGEADFYSTVSADSFNTVSNIPNYTAVNESSSSIYYLALRSSESSAKNPKMADVNFRKSLLQAIDIPTYVSSMLEGKASYSKSVLGPTLVGYVEKMEESGYEYDPVTAQKTIDENGWSGETVTLLISTRDWQQDLAVYMQAQLQKVGITVNIVSQEWASFLSTAKEDQSFDMTILSWANVTGDGQQMLEPNFSSKNGTRVKYNNAEFDALVEASAKTTDLAKREEAMAEAVKMIQDDAVVAPLYSQNQLYVYNSSKFDQVTLDKGGLYRLSEVKIVK